MPQTKNPRGGENIFSESGGSMYDEVAPTGELTLMFFFAADNTLAPSMVSQLKAIKDAGFQKDTTVMVRYDPNETGALTRVFDINCERKREQREMGKPETVIGDGNDPFVRNLRGDVVSAQDSALESARGGKGRGTGEAEEALSGFLELCRTKRPARHYMLFLVGHGMIVGNDAFLSDEHPVTGITLRKLGKILRGFSERVKEDKAQFELVGMHSCSMSAVELAYELQGTANYMMASEGVSFVGTWPYRQLLKKIFNTVHRARDNKLNEDDVKVLLRKLHYLCLHNSTDFMFAGFSADLAMCSLDPKKVKRLNTPLRALTKALKEALAVECGKELILLSHWKSQSYWQENYADLYDFCRCLAENCGEGRGLCRCPGTKCDADGKLRKAIATACAGLMDKIDPAGPSEPEEKLTNAQKLKLFDRLVVLSDQIGPTYQYSHGLSVYFPWSRPLDDTDEERDKDGGVLAKYQKYKFTSALGKGSWLSFLEMYFTETQRKRRDVEDGVAPVSDSQSIEVIPGARAATAAGGGPAGDSLPAGPGGKPDPAMGGVCNCASIKNFPPDFIGSEGTVDAYRRPEDRTKSA